MQNQDAEGASSSMFASFAANPFPMLAQMRSMGPLLQFPIPMGTVPLQPWLVTQYKEAVQILKDKRFTVDIFKVDGGGIIGQQIQAMMPSTIADSMANVDEPDHMRLRGLVSQVFTPKYIQGLRPHIQRIADELLDAVQDRGTMDIVHDFAYPLPINVISDMLGVPQENREQVRRWSSAIGGQGAHGEDVRAFENYVAQLVDDKRQHPQDDLISQLVRVEEHGDRLSTKELLAMVGLLIFAGHETTSNLIASGTLLLLDNPEQLEKLKGNLSLVPEAVEELLRTSTPVLTPAPRFAVEDVEISGQQIHKGDVVMVLLASANRDETQFTDSEELEIARTLNRHIAFGQGIHVCLGAPLARLEADIAFTTLLKRMPNLRLNISRDAISWHGNFSLRGLNALPVAF